MKKIIMIMLILLTCSGIVMADNSDTVTITGESNKDELGTKRTTLQENINQYFTWTIPSLLTVSDGATLAVSVTEAHLNSGTQLKILVNGIDDDGKIQLYNPENTNNKGSKVTLSNDNGNISNKDTILTVDSCSFTEGADTSEKTADITLSVEKNFFQFAGKYIGSLTFVASIKE